MDRFIVTLLNRVEDFCMEACQRSTIRLRNPDKESRAFVQSCSVSLLLGGLILVAGLLSGAVVHYLSQSFGLSVPYSLLCGGVTGVVVATGILRWIWKI